MKRYIIEERETSKERCDGCMYEKIEFCPDVRIASCSRENEKGEREYFIFVLVKEEEIK